MSFRLRMAISDHQFGYVDSAKAIYAVKGGVRGAGICLSNPGQTALMAPNCGGCRSGRLVLGQVNMD
jgi:hypothetical protein